MIMGGDLGGTPPPKFEVGVAHASVPPNISVHQIFFHPAKLCAKSRPMFIMLFQFDTQ